MGWARIDDGFDDHPKVVALLDEDDATAGAVAVALWTLSLTWAHRNTRKRGQVHGLLPAGLPRRFLGAMGKDAAQLLVKHNLWEPQDDGGWVIHDFDEYLPTDETREARSAAGKRGADKRWAARRAEKAAAMANSHDPDGNLPSASQSGDSKTEASDGSRAPARRAIPKGIAPTPGPEPDQPSAAGPPPPAESGNTPLSITQRSKRITDTYAAAQPMCKWPAINGIVIRAIKAEKYADSEIEAALLRMATDGTTVSVESLRIELEGFTPRRNARASPGSETYRNPSNQDEYDEWKGQRSA